MAKAKGVHWNPESAVWDNIRKAEVFTAKARGSDLSLDWCLEITCGALWAALMVFNKHIMRDEKSESTTTKWFKENGSLVWKIRNAVEHYDFSWGIGQGFTPRPGGPGVTTDPDGTAWHVAGSREGEGDTVHTFVWVAQDGGTEEIRVDDALAELEDIRQRVKQIVWSKNRTEYIKFHTETQQPSNPEQR